MRLRRRSGFTMFEIVIVVVIVMVLISISLPRMRGSFEATRMKQAARDVTALLRFSRDVAVLQERPCEVRFAPDLDQYQLVAFDEEGERIEIRERRRSRRWDDEDALMISADWLEVKELPRRVHFAMIYSAAERSEDTGLPRVVFYPDGSATPATIALQDEGERTMRVEVYRTTGMTRVEEGLPVERPAHQQRYYGPEL